MLLDGLVRIEEFFGRYAQSYSQLTQGTEVRILPVSMPETVVGLTPASRANLAWVHIRKRRMFSKRSPVLSTLTPRLYLHHRKHTINCIKSLLLL